MSTAIFSCTIELKCMDLAKNLFNADFVDVRPISGVCANLSIYSEFLPVSFVLFFPLYMMNKRLFIG